MTTRGTGEKRLVTTVLAGVSLTRNSAAAHAQAAAVKAFVTTVGAPAAVPTTGQIWPRTGRV